VPREVDGIVSQNFAPASGCLDNQGYGGGAAAFPDVQPSNCLSCSLEAKLVSMIRSPFAMPDPNLAGGRAGVAHVLHVIDFVAPLERVEFARQQAVAVEV
jgi:hypothetical protein